MIDTGAGARLLWFFLHPLRLTTPIGLRHSAYPAVDAPNDNFTMTTLAIVVTMLGLLVSISTYASGLPRYALAIAGCMLAGLSLQLLSLEPFSLALFFLAIVMILYSKKVMQEHGLGPYAEAVEDESER